ncbi:MAG: hypothetical protein ACPG1C_09440 [Alphaproteobacteria bacterium]
MVYLSKINVVAVLLLCLFSMAAYAEQGGADAAKQHRYSDYLSVALDGLERAEDPALQADITEVKAALSLLKAGDDNPVHNNLPDDIKAWIAQDRLKSEKAIRVKLGAPAALGVDEALAIWAGREAQAAGMVNHGRVARLYDLAAPSDGAADRFIQSLQNWDLKEAVSDQGWPEDASTVAKLWGRSAIGDQCAARYMVQVFASWASAPSSVNNLYIALDELHQMQGVGGYLKIHMVDGPKQIAARKAGGAPPEGVVWCEDDLGRVLDRESAIETVVEAIGAGRAPKNLLETAFRTEIGTLDIQDETAKTLMAHGIKLPFYLAWRIAPTGAFGVWNDDEFLITAEEAIDHFYAQNPEPTLSNMVQLLKALAQMRPLPGSTVDRELLHLREQALSIALRIALQSDIDTPDYGSNLAIATNFLHMLPIETVAERKLVEGALRTITCYADEKWPASSYSYQEGEHRLSAIYIYLMLREHGSLLAHRRLLELRLPAGYHPNWRSVDPSPWGRSLPLFTEAEGEAMPKLLATVQAIEAQMLKAGGCNRPAAENISLQQVMSDIQGLKAKINRMQTPWSSFYEIKSGVEFVLNSLKVLFGGVAEEGVVGEDIEGRKD